MPLNATTYLEGHGWRGKGVPLDGEQGRGLKKPLALPQKRNVKGLGKERDRATEWWDSLFEASAKKLQTPATAGADIVSPSAAAAVTRTQRQTPSLMAMAKREHARKQLMSGFVRGKPNKEYEEKLQQLEQALAQQQQSAKGTSVRASTSEEVESSLADNKDRKLNKEQRREARRKRKLLGADDAQAQEAEEKKKRDKGSRNEETMANGMPTKKRKATATEGVKTASIGKSEGAEEDSDKARRKESRRKKRAEKSNGLTTSAKAESTAAADAKRERKKHKKEALTISP